MDPLATVSFMTMVVLFALYMLPTIIAGFRGHHNRAAIGIVNLFLGWSVVGWVIALAWAMTVTQPTVVAPLPPGR